MARKDGLRALITSATPVIVPPVPTPEIRMSTFPSVSGQISSAVVRRWTSGLAGFSNCCGMKTSFSACGDLLGLLDRTPHALGRRREDQLRPKGLEHLAPLQAHGFRHGQEQPVAPGCCHKGQGDARVAAGGLDDERLRADLAGPLGRLDHRQADAVLDGGQRVVALHLGQDRCACTE